MAARARFRTEASGANVILIEDDPTPHLVVDCHVHLGPTETPGKDAGRSGRLVAEMDAAGVDFACVFASAGKGQDYPTETELIIRISEETGGRVIPFARVHPFWRGEAVSALRRAAESGVRGLKLHPFIDGAFPANDEVLVRPLMDVVSEFRLCVLVHSGWSWSSAPGLIAHLARQYPDVSVIVGHSGRYGYHREAGVLGVEVPNLLFDISGLATPGAVEELVHIVGPERVLLGSDHPYTPMGFELEKVGRWTTLPLEQRTLICGGNAADLLGIAQREKASTVLVTEGPRGDVSL